MIVGYLQLPPGLCITFECARVWRLHVDQQQDPARHAWSIRSLIQTFPNIRELYLDTYYLDWAADEDRQRNIDAQLYRQ